MKALVIFLALMLFAGVVEAQTYSARAVAFTEALKGSALTAEQQQNVALSFAEHYPQFLNCVDPENCTNAEYAECLIESQRAHVKEILRVHGRLAAQEAANPAIEQAGEDAAAVMDP